VLHDIYCILLGVLFLGIIVNAHCHWLKRDAVVTRQPRAATTRNVAAGKIQVKSSKSLISRKFNVDLLTNYICILYMAKGKSFPSVYCSSVSVQPLLHRSLYTVNIFYNGPPPFPQIAHFQCMAPPNTWFLRLTQLSPQTASRSVQSFLQGSRTWPTDRQTDRQTDHSTPCEAIGRYRQLKLRCGLIIITSTVPHWQ